MEKRMPERGEVSGPQNIALIGFMGSGKSTVGRILAGSLGWEVADTDALVEADAGKPIPILFREDGEIAFRDRETQAVCVACSQTKKVVSTGGGAILRAHNVAVLRDSCFVVWLTARPDIVLLRTARTAQNRPLLAQSGDDPNARLAHVLRMLGERSPLYQAASHAIVDTSDRAPESVARDVARRWTKFAEALQ